MASRRLNLVKSPKSNRVEKVFKRGQGETEKERESSGWTFGFKYALEEFDGGEVQADGFWNMAIEYFLSSSSSS